MQLNSFSTILDSHSFKKKYTIYKNSCIGTGSFSTIYLGKNNFNHQKVAIKYINTKYLNQKQKNNLLSEAQLLSSLNHTNIIKFYDSYIKNNKILIVLEYCNNGDLNSFLKK